MIENYVGRKLLEREKYYEYGRYFPYLESFHYLQDLITKNTKRILLLSDAGYGKSTELKMITSRLIEEKNQNFIPLFIELNTYTNEEIEDYVRNKIGEESESLLNFEKSKLLFLFDEFDQVIDKIKAVRKIKKFVNKYDESTFVIACRTNFYSGQFENFNVFVLLPFDINNIREYVNKSISYESESFLKQLREYSLFDIAENPFFLYQLIKIYKTDKIIPENCSDIFSRIISIILEDDEKRLSDKHDLRVKYPISEIERDLMYMSLVMETLQRNFISIEEFREIITDNLKREVIPDLSLIKKSFFKSGDVYQFQHNNFQEYLSAKKLLDQNLNIILDFISFKRNRSWIEKLIYLMKYADYGLLGIKISKIILTFLNNLKFKRIDKINPSWINTIAFLCQLREGGDLLEYLKGNEPELTLKFEISRIDESKRENLFKTIFEKYTNREILFDRDKIDYEKLANFAKTKEIYDYLMKFALSREHYIHRYNAIQMLGRMKKFADEPLHNLLIAYIKDENEKQSVRHICLYALSWLGFATKETIDNLIYLKDSNDDWILSGLYYLIRESKYTDKYVNILLAGIHRLKNSILADLSWNITKGLEKIESVEGVRKIIKYFINKPGYLKEFNIERSIEKIVNSATKAYELDKSIYKDMKELVKIVAKKYMDKIVSNIQVFFKETETTFKLFKEIYNESGIKNNYFILAYIADDNCVNFLIDEYLNKKLLDRDIWAFINFLPINKYDYFLKIINEKTKNFYPQPLPDYEKEQKDRKKRELEIIFSREEFLKEVAKIFNGEGKKGLSFADIDDILFSSFRDRKYNDFVVRELKNIFERNKSKKWKLFEVKDFINKSEYEWFTVSHVFNLLHYGSEIELSEEQKAIIKNFCFKNLKNVNFKEALKPKIDGVRAEEPLAIFLWYFLRKFDLEYPEDVLLDMLSFDWVEGIQFVGIDYLGRKLPHEKIKNRILENIGKGIEINQIIKNHISYCKKYSIFESKDWLYEIVENPEIEIKNRLLALETVAEFQNSVDLIEKILDTNVHELFSKAAKILTTRNYKKYKKKLEQKLLSKDEKIALESSKILIEKKNLKGIRFHADFLKRTKKFEIDIDDKNPIQKVNTIKALSILFDLLKFSYEYKEEIKQDKYHTLNSAIINILKNIAIEDKDYSNFNKVKKQLKNFIRKYQTKYEGVNFLNTDYDDIEKSFFINFYGKISVDEAINKVEIITN